MSYIASALLTVVKDEEATFWAFFSVEETKNWRLLSLDKTPKLCHMIDVVKMRIAEKCPKLYKYFLLKGIDPAVVLPQMLINIFLYR